jgi:hypothetical protein
LFGFDGMLSLGAISLVDLLEVMSAELIWLGGFLQNLN